MPFFGFGGSDYKIVGTNVKGGGSGTLPATVGGNNMGLGVGSLPLVINGAENLAFGNGAGPNVVDGDGNLFWGYQAGSLLNDPGSNNIIIDSPGSAGALLFNDAVIIKGAALGDSAIAIGEVTRADNFGVAIGNNIFAGVSGIGIGNGASAADSGIALGQTSNAAVGAIAIGNVSGNGVTGASVCIGTNARGPFVGSVSDLIAIGEWAQGSANSAIAIGGSTTADLDCVVIGHGCSANTQYSVVVGRNIATPAQTIAIGQATEPSVRIGLYDFSVSAPMQLAYSSGVAVTAPNDVLENTLATFSIPAGMMGTLGAAIFNLVFSHTLTDSVTLRIRINGTLVAFAVPTTGTVTSLIAIMQNKANQALNYFSHISTTFNTALSSALGDLAIDSSVAMLVSITVQKTVAADPVVLRQNSCRVGYKA